MEVGHRISSLQEASGGDSVHVYCLIDPETYRVRYIGQTIDLRTRYRAHFRCDTTSGAGKAVKSWVTDLKQRGLAPILEVLCVCDHSERRQREKQFIAAAILAREPLLNERLVPHSEGFTFPLCVRGSAFVTREVVELYATP